MSSNWKQKTIKVLHRKYPIWSRANWIISILSSKQEVGQSTLIVFLERMQTVWWNMCQRSTEQVHMYCMSSSRFTQSWFFGSVSIMLKIPLKELSAREGDFVCEVQGESKADAEKKRIRRASDWLFLRQCFAHFSHMWTRKRAASFALPMRPEFGLMDTGMMEKRFKNKKLFFHQFFPSFRLRVEWLVGRCRYDKVDGATWKRWNCPLSVGCKQSTVLYQNFFSLLFFIFHAQTENRELSALCQQMMKKKVCFHFIRVVVKILSTLPKSFSMFKLQSQLSECDYCEC